MTIQQIKYIVTALAIVQVMIILTAIILIVKNVVVGMRKRDYSRYRKAAVVFALAFGLLIIIGIIQFFILLE